MIDQGSLQHALTKLADKFQEELVVAQGTAAQKIQQPSGWGQFLDSARKHRQVGLYGTCAGTIVLSLAGRDSQNLTLREVAATLSEWWNEGNPRPYGSIKFSQLLRLAFFYIAVRLCPGVALSDCRDSVRDELIARILPERMWGDWWISAEQHDDTPRLLSTSIALLCCSLLNESELPTELHEVASSLENRLKAASKLTPFELTLASAAVVSVKGASAAEHVHRLVRNIAWTQSCDLTVQNVYFYDFEQATGDTKNKAVGRDYFLVSSELVFGLAGLQTGVSWLARLRSESTAENLVSHLEEHEGLYRPATGERISTVNQAWAALFLALARDAAAGRRVTGRFMYQLLRERQDNRFIKFFFRPGVTILAGVVPIIISDSGQIERIAVAVCSAIIVAVYGQKVIGAALAPIFRRV